MALMTAQEYVESLRKLNTRVYMFGEKIENWVDHPMIRPSINCVAMTYALAQDPQYADLMTVKSSLTGHTINRFTHLHQSTEDLINKVKMQRLLGQKTAACFQRCVGMDAMNAVFSSTYEIDEACGTKYHENFLKFLTRVQDEDLAVDGAMTDVKGDRSLAPSKQADPDLFLHVVERTPDGVYVTGAKAQVDSVTYDDLVELEHSLDPAYREGGRCAFMFADTTLKAIKKLKDGQGRPLWLPGIDVKEPASILGYRYVINQSVPAMAATAKSVLFGDFSKYIIRDAMGITMYRFADSAFAQKGQVGFLAFMRSGGVLTDAQAVKFFQHGAAA